jgi:AcrR family transcriptional regulator
MDAALALADRDGLEAVTIRALAADVGVPPMTLYAHFADKDALYEGMRARIVERFITAGAKTTWRELLETLAHDVVVLHRKHPSLVPLMARGGAPPRSMLGVFDRLLAMMHAAGFALEQALRAYMSVIGFALGMAMVERTIMGGDGEKGRLGLLRDVLTRLPAGSYPNLAFVASRIDEWSFDDVVESGVRALLDGVERERGTPPPAIRPRRSAR